MVFGGYSHHHNEEEICYDNQLYLYHLGCNTWVSHEILGNTDQGDLYLNTNPGFNFFTFSVTRKGKLSLCLPWKAYGGVWV